MFGLQLRKRSWNTRAYQLNRYRGPGFKLPVPCCEWCDSRLRTLSESVERVERTLVDLTAASKELSDPSAWLQMDAALKMLEHAINSDAGYRDVLLTHPETMTNAFKAYHNAVGAALARAPSQSDNRNGRLNGKSYRLMPAGPRRRSDETAE